MLQFRHVSPEDKPATRGLTRVLESLTLAGRGPRDWIPAALWFLSGCETYYQMEVSLRYSTPDTPEMML